MHTVATSHPRVPRFARSVLTLSSSLCLALVWAHALAAWLNQLHPAAPAAWAWPLSLGVTIAAGVASWRSRQRPAWRSAAALGLAGWLCLAALVPSARAPCLALWPVTMASSAWSAWLWRRLAWLDRAALRSRTARLSVGAAALLALVQLARLSTWASDPGSDWFLSTRHPFWAKHECLPAYIYGAELALRGEPNVYDARHYPGLTPSAEPHTRVSQMHVEDPYQYAPQFLLWPAAALGLTHDYPTLRTWWLALQTTLFVGLALGLAGWIGGRNGRTAALLMPLSLSAFPVLHALQYGQFHLTAVMLAVAAMLAFEARRVKLGGALLAAATLSKLFPGILLLVLLARRRFRALAWTGAWGAVLTLTAALSFGLAPLLAFVRYQIPRLQSGAAFAFGEAWPEVRELLIAANQGVYGLTLKLGELGVAGADASLGSALNLAYAIALAAAAYWLGRRAGGFDRAQHALTWLALLGLASLASAGAFADYVPATAIWLLSLSAGVQRKHLVAQTLWFGAWLLQYTLLGATPIGDWFDPRIMLPLSALSSLWLFGLFGWVLLSVARACPQSTARSSQLQVQPVSA